jgi:hypothetical protein
VAQKPDSATEDLPLVLPRDLATALFNQEARRIVGLSGDEFLARWNSGLFRSVEDTPHEREISYLILLIPFGRQLSR